MKKSLALALLLGVAACAAPESRVGASFEDTQWIMGTSLRVVAEMDSTQAPARLARLFESATAWEHWLSHYRDDSVVAELQRRAPESVAVATPVHTYFERSREDLRRTAGSFDIFHSHSSPDSRAAWAALRLSPAGEPSTVGLGEGTVVDPGGNGKGFAVDAMVDSLRAWKVTRALVDFGGSSWAVIGRPREAPAWTIDVVDADETLLGAVALRDAALSISQTRLRGSDARPHIEDPSTGEVVTATRCAIVRSPSSIDAEVLSTALIVRGVEGFSYLENYPGAEAVLVESGAVRRSHACDWFTPAR